MSQEQIIWIQPDGTQRNLMNIPETAVMPGRAGFNMPPVRHILEAVPYKAGKRHKAIAVDERRLDLPLFVEAEDWEALRDREREIERWFWPDPVLGEGRLRIIMPDGSSREILAYYEAGLQGNEGVDQAGLTWRRSVITLLAAEPYFRSTAATVQLFTQGAPEDFFPLLPIKLTSISLFESAQVDNLGDVESFPVWTITGPATRVIITNTSYTPERVLDLTFNLLDGETITIDTDEDARTVTHSDGTDLYYTLSKRDMWPLRPGINDIEISLEDSEEGSEVSLSYYPRYLGQ